MLEWLWTKRLEIKYLLLGGLMLWALVALSHSDRFSGFEQQVVNFMDHAVAFGLLGLFFGALISNMAVLINIPYTLVALTFFLVNKSANDVIAFSVATGLGGALGKLIAYTLASNIAGQVDSLSKSAIFRWVKRNIRRHPRLTPLFVFAGTASFLPNDMILLPLALVRYPARRLALPLVLGKVGHGLLLSVAFVSAIGLTGDKITPTVKVDLTFGAIIATLLAIIYQIEKARADDQDSPFAAARG